ncbi:putative Short chain dehydrogenase [Seiridium cardinale]
MQPRRLSLLTSQLCAKPPASLSNINLAGQTAIVTGGNSGLGLEAARQLLAAGLSYLIITVRSSDKGKFAAEQLKSNAPSSKMEVWSLDMSAYESVRAFADCCNRLPRLDIVILNAGVAKLAFELNQATGHEETIQVNYLSTSLLAMLLVPILREKAAKSPGRLTIVSSGNAFMAKFENNFRRPLLPSFDDPSIPYDGMERYNVSKLLGHYWIKKMAHYVSPDDVIIDLVEPGLTKGTSLFREVGGIMGLAWSGIKGALGRPVETSASTYIDAAVSHGRDAHCSFLLDWQIHPYASMVYEDGNEKVANQLWDETLEELEFSGIRGIMESVRKT